MSHAFFKYRFKDGYALIPKRHILTATVSAEGIVAVYVSNITDPFVIEDRAECTAFLRWLDGGLTYDGKRAPANAGGKDPARPAVAGENPV